MRTRKAERGMRNVLVVFLATAALLALPVVAAGQVGHPPDRSPYHDLRAKQSASFLAGYLRGQRGKPRAAPSDGPIFGVRYDRQVGTAAEVLVGLGYARLDRYLVDPTVPEASRFVGPVNSDLAFMEAGASLLITGRKSWRGFAPYVGAMVGVVFEANFQASTFNFGTRLSAAPHIGIKWFPVQAIAFKVEARDIIWRVRWPDSWFVTQITGVPTVLETGTHKQSEWLHHPTLLVSLGYTFAF